MKLYENALSPNARRALLVVEHLGLDVERVHVDFMKGEQKKPEFLALNGNGMVPVLVDGDFVLNESRVIVQYLSSKKPGSGLWPDDAQTRFDITRWQFWDAAHFSPQLGSIAYERMIKPMMGLGEPDETKVKEAEERFDRFARVLDKQLEGRTYLVGKSLTVADLSVACSLTYASASGVKLDPYPALKSWLARIAELDCWQKTLPKMG